MEEQALHSARADDVRNHRTLEHCLRRWRCNLALPSFTKASQSMKEVFLHIGLPKTGTTAIQGALAEARGRLRDLGVVYPGRGLNHWRESNGLIPWVSAGGLIYPGTERHWLHLIEEVQSVIDKKVIISSEQFAGATNPEIDVILDKLQPTRVLITLRPPERIIASRWQQHVRSGLTQSFDEWLADVKVRPVLRGTSPFDLSSVVETWAHHVGAERITVIVVSDDHAFLPRAFERILDIPEGTLQLTGSHHENRSWSFDEVELQRNINIYLHDYISTPQQQQQFLTRPAERMTALRTLLPGEHRIPVPASVVEECRATGQRDAHIITDLGVTVLGSLEDLSPSTPIVESPAERSLEATTDAAAFLYAELVKLQIAELSTSSRFPRIVRWIPPALLPFVYRIWVRVRR